MLQRTLEFSIFVRTEWTRRIAFICVQMLQNSVMTYRLFAPHQNCTAWCVDTWICSCTSRHGVCRVHTRRSRMRLTVANHFRDGVRYCFRGPNSPKSQVTLHDLSLPMNVMCIELRARCTSLHTTADGLSAAFIITTRIFLVKFKHRGWYQPNGQKK